MRLHHDLDITQHDSLFFHNTVQGGKKKQDTERELHMLPSIQFSKVTKYHSFHTNSEDENETHFHVRRESSNRCTEVSVF